MLPWRNVFMYARKAFDIRSVRLSDRQRFALFEVGFTLFVVACCAQGETRALWSTRMRLTIPSNYHKQRYIIHHLPGFAIHRLRDWMRWQRKAFDNAFEALFCYLSERGFAQSVLQQFKSSSIDSEASCNQSLRL